MYTIILFWVGILLTVLFGLRWIMDVTDFWKIEESNYHRVVLLMIAGCILLVVSSRLFFNSFDYVPIDIKTTTIELPKVGNTNNSYIEDDAYITVFLDNKYQKYRKNDKDIEIKPKKENKSEMETIETTHDLRILNRYWFVESWLFEQFFIPPTKTESVRIFHIK